MAVFENWGRTHHCSPAAILQPASEQEIVALVQRARAASRRIKVVGAAHSWSDIAMTDHWLVNLDRLNAVLSVDRANNHVTVQAGMRLHELNDQLALRGLAMPILGSVVEQSVAGVVSTGTHGSSRVHGNLATFVVGMRLVTGTGETIQLDANDERLAALRVSLGAAGILTELTLQVEPAFNLSEHSFPVAFDQACARMDEFVDQHEYAKLWWFPHTDRVQVFTYERTRRPRNTNRLAAWFDARVVNDILFAAILERGDSWPAAIPTLNKLICAAAFSEQRRVGRSDELFQLPMPPVHEETEWAMPREAAPDALRRMRALVQAESLKVNFIQEVRFVKADDNWMSPAYQRETCQVGAYIAKSPSARRYLQATQDIFRDLGGRPHWGKQFDTTPEEVAALYPRAADFAALVRDLDPEGMFANAFTDRVLGPAVRGGHPGPGAGD